MKKRLLSREYRDPLISGEILRGSFRFLSVERGVATFVLEMGFLLVSCVLESLSFSGWENASPSFPGFYSLHIGLPLIRPAMSNSTFSSILQHCVGR